MSQFSFSDKNKKFKENNIKFEFLDSKLIKAHPFLSIMLRWFDLGVYFLHKKTVLPQIKNFSDQNVKIFFNANFIQNSLRSQKTLKTTKKTVIPQINHVIPQKK